MKAFEERFMIRDMAMMADHNNFMMFDINNEKEALDKLQGFAKYVLLPLNPVLMDRIMRMDLTKNLASNSLEESKESSQYGSQQEGATGSSGRQSSSVAMSSLQRAARLTLINFANQRKSSYNWPENADAAAAHISGSFGRDTSVTQQIESIME